MPYDVQDDFEDARGYGLDPEKACRASRMYQAWFSAIQKEFPEALKGDPEDRDLVMLGMAALLGEFAGLVWAASDEEIARSVIEQKFQLATHKMESLVAQYVTPMKKT